MEHAQVAADPDYERLVREAWEWCECTHRRRQWEELSVHIYVYLPHTGIPFPSWQAAWKYTENLKREIREIDEEIEFARFARTYQGAGAAGPIIDRTIARLESIRADLARGMKEPK